MQQNLHVRQSHCHLCVCIPSFHYQLERILEPHINIIDLLSRRLHVSRTLFATWFMGVLLHRKGTRRRQRWCQGWFWRLCFHYPLDVGSHVHIWHREKVFKHTPKTIKLSGSSFWGTASLKLTWITHNVFGPSQFSLVQVTNRFETVTK